VKANGDDYAHYAGTFDEYVDSADTMEQIVEFVVAAEKVAARKTVPKDPPPTVLQKPPQTPASSPAAKQQRAEKQKEKKRQKALDKQSRTIDLSIPAQPVPLQTQWKAVATASASLPAPTPSPASKPLSFVENLLAKVEKWDRKTDKGKTVSLSEFQATELLYGLKAIAISGGQQAFYVGFSDNEQKYNCKVCIKAIAGHSQTVSQATTHKPHIISLWTAMSHFQRSSDFLSRPAGLFAFRLDRAGARRWCRQSTEQKPTGLISPRNSD
jgi:hypothetical protein